MNWFKITDQRPAAGRLIVKRWKSGAVWAGRYTGTDKDSSFDEWCYVEDDLVQVGSIYIHEQNGQQYPRPTFYDAKLVSGDLLFVRREKETQ